jgi:hypothetical protein
VFKTNPYFEAHSGGGVPGLPLSDDTGMTVAILVIFAVVIAAAARPFLGASGKTGRARSNGRLPWTAPAKIIPMQGPATRTPAPHDPGAIRRQALHDPVALRDPARQMHAISLIEFETQPLLNRSESRLLPALESATRGFGQGHRLMAQTSMGEILRPKSYDDTDAAHRDAYFAINAKRLDFAVFNRFGHLVVAIEYQGHAHYHATSFMRDAVKREVLRKAGVAFLELPAGIEPAAAAALLTAQLDLISGRRSA